MSRTLLLADSSPATHRLVELMFSADGVDVIAVEDGEQAIERLPLVRPDIVLADIAVPRRSGYEVAAFVRAHPQLSRVPVLLLAGAFEPVDEARVRQAGAAGVLVKPLAPHDVIARVRALVEASGPARAAATGTGTAAAPQPPADPAAARLDDYFERLDAAFANLEARRASALRAAPDPRPALEASTGTADVPTLDGVLGGKQDAPPPSATTASDVTGTPISDELIERLTSRMVERLGTDTVRDVVAEVLSEVAGQPTQRGIERTRQG